MDNSKNLSQVIRNRLQTNGKRFWAGDNISEFISEDEKHQLIGEVTDKFEAVLQSLLIDTENDPNSKGTAKRLAKMTLTIFSFVLASHHHPFSILSFASLKV